MHRACKLIVCVKVQLLHKVVLVGWFVQVRRERYGKSEEKKVKQCSTLDPLLLPFPTKSVS